MRNASICRETRETQISLTIELDGEGKSHINTPVPFMNHMLELFARHGFFDLAVDETGDVDVDYHHTIEDLGIVMGEAIAKAAGDKAGIRRYGSFLLPMDETLVQVALDLSGRAYLSYNVDAPAAMVKDIDIRLFREFFQALVNKAQMNLHIDLIRGEEAHHVIEAIFKAFAKALDQALTTDPRVNGVLSTKGSL